MSKDYKLLRILNPIGNFPTFSKYNESLEKLFKKRSLKTLLYSLNNPIQFNSNYIEERLSKKEFERKTSKKDKNKKNLLEYNGEDSTEKKKKKKSKKISVEPWSIPEKSRVVIYTYKDLDFYKYNPNYNSIYKNVPSFSFTKASKKRFIFDKEIKDKCHTDRKIINERNVKGNINKDFHLITSLTNKSSHEVNKENKSYDKNKHTFRFSKYSPRKTMEYKVNNRVTNLKTINSFIHMNRTIDFNKMAKRNKNNFIMTSTLKNPSICYYNPRYEYLETKPKKIEFNPEGFKENLKFIKKKKLKKVVMSYDVQKEYSTIDNSKLVTADSIYKLLNY